MSGLAESRRFSSFCSRSKLCDRVCVAFVGAMFSKNSDSLTSRRIRIVSDGDVSSIC